MSLEAANREVYLLLKEGIRVLHEVLAIHEAAQEQRDLRQFAALWAHETTRNGQAKTALDRTPPRRIVSTKPSSVLRR